MTISDERAIRIEEKVDRLVEAITHFKIVDERQKAIGERVGAAEQEIAAVKSTLHSLQRDHDKWVNRGIGLWATVASLYTLFQLILPYLTRTL